MSYGKLLSILAAQSRDIAAAEDALSGAFASALQTWPVRGVPENPDAWLLSAAYRTILNQQRHQRVRDANVTKIESRYHVMQDDPPPVADERLKLLFVCAHPAIGATDRTPLMLRVVQRLCWYCTRPARPAHRALSPIG
jgi:RNA polymerase sigma-70 factor (ECF subfamily)